MSCYFFALRRRADAMTPETCCSERKRAADDIFPAIPSATLDSEHRQRCLVLSADSINTRFIRMTPRQAMPKTIWQPLMRLG
jgi:hypothetical protein